jgi:hypothetical protein
VLKKIIEKINPFELLKESITAKTKEKAEFHSFIDLIPRKTDCYTSLKRKQYGY